MRVIPVLDLLQREVVRGVAGRRSEYRTIESQLCGDSQPINVARALRDKLQLSTVYVADLDAILHNRPNWDAYRDIAQAGLELWIDAGLKDLDQTRALGSFLEQLPEQGALIAGLETVDSPELLAEMLSLAGPERLIFSLDLNGGQPLTESAVWSGQTPEQILRQALSLGVRRFILLDLARVGMGSGVGTETLCRHLRSASPTAEIIAGGGVRHIADLHALEKQGCNGVLVASALHDGRLSAEDLAEFK